MSPNITIPKINLARKQNGQLVYNIFLDIVSVLVIVAIMLLVIQPTKYMKSILNGLDLFFISVLPSLLPFLFLTKILSSIGTTKKLSKLFNPITKKFLKVPSNTSFIILSSYICGYPIGAKLVGEMVKYGELTNEEAKRVIPLVTTSGPIFVIGSVGASMFSNTNLGAIIFVVHILSSFITGIIFCRFKHKKLTKIEKPTLKEQKVQSFSLEQTTISTFNSVLMVAVYVSIFYMFIDMAYDLNLLKGLTFIIAKIFSIFNIDFSTATAISSGIIEMTRGLKELSFISSNSLKLIIGSGLISFGGISIILQSLAFLSNTHIKAKYFIFVKLVQTVITILIATLVSLIFF